MAESHPRTPDGRYFVVRGRLWRLSNPALPRDILDELVHELMAARRAIRDARGDPTASAGARGRVDVAKRALGERGPVWWEDGAPAVGGLNEVLVFRRDSFEKVATIPVGKLPHGIWPSGDGSRMYVGLENGYAIAAIDTATNREVAEGEVTCDIYAFLTTEPNRATLRRLSKRRICISQARHQFFGNRRAIRYASQSKLSTPTGKKHSSHVSQAGRTLPGNTAS